MLKVIAKTETVGNEKAGVSAKVHFKADESVHFEDGSVFDGRVQLPTEIEAVLHALKDTYKKEFLMAALAVFEEDDEE